MGLHPHIERQQAVLVPAAEAVRNRLGRRYGFPVWGVASAADLWRHDPDYAELNRLNETSDDLSDEAADLFADLLAMPATSQAGALAKLRLAVSSYVWPERAEREFHHDATITLVRDAARALDGLT